MAKKIDVHCGVGGGEWTADLLCREFRCWCAYCTRTRNFGTVEPLLESNHARFSKQKSGVWKSGRRAAGERWESGRWWMKKDDDDGKTEDDEWKWQGPDDRKKLKRYIYFWFIPSHSFIHKRGIFVIIFMSLKCLALTLFLCILGIEILHWYTAGLLLYAKNHVSTFQGISISRDMRTTRLPICAHRQPSHGQGTWCPPLELLQTIDHRPSDNIPYRGWSFGQHRSSLRQHWRHLDNDSLLPHWLPRSVRRPFIRSSRGLARFLSVVHRPNWPATWICRALHGENGAPEFHAPEGQQLVVSLRLRRNVCEIVVHRWRNLCGCETINRKPRWVFQSLIDSLSNCPLATNH